MEIWKMCVSTSLLPAEVLKTHYNINNSSLQFLELSNPRLNMVF